MGLGASQQPSPQMPVVLVVLSLRPASWQKEALHLCQLDSARASAPSQCAGGCPWKGSRPPLECQQRGCIFSCKSRQPGLQCHTELSDISKHKHRYCLSISCPTSRHRPRIWLPSLLDRSQSLHADLSSCARPFWLCLMNCHFSCIAQLCAPSRPLL